MKINLPIVIDNFYDYHDIAPFYENLKKIMPTIKYEELSLSDAGYYRAIFYTTKNCVKYKELINESHS